MLYLTVVVFAMCCYFATAGFPIILIPGAGGSRLMAKWDKPWQTGLSLCGNKQTDWTQLWPTPQLAVPFFNDCWVDNMQLDFNAADGTTSNVRGVDFDAPGYGGTDKLEYLTDQQVSVTNYMKDLVAEIQKWGYTSGISVRGAPYDFRKSPTEQAVYFRNLKSLIENTYTINANKPVVLVAHSLGGLYIRYFLEQQTKDWKKKYIKAMVSMGSPYIGLMTAVKGNTQGWNVESAILPADKMKIAERTWLSLTAMLPNEKFWPKTPLITTSTKSYTTANYQEFFQDIKHPKGLQMYQSQKGKINPEVPPGVEVHCLVGTGIDTDVTHVYQKNWWEPWGNDKFPDGTPAKVTPVDGDNSVPTFSASFCKNWAKTQTEKFVYKEFNKVGHIELVHNQEVFKYLKTVVAA